MRGVIAMKEFQVGVKGVIVVDGRVLLLKRQNRWSGIFWELPGGRIEGEEAIEETLQRELREEVPSIAQATIGELLHAARVPTKDDSVGLILLYYRVLAALDAVVLSDEHIGYTWASAADLPALADGQDGIAIFDYSLAAVRAALTS